MAPTPRFGPFMVNGTLQNHPNQPTRIPLVDIARESFATKFAAALRGFTRITPTMKNVTVVTDLPAVPPLAHIGDLTHYKSFGETVVHTFYGLKNRTEISGRPVILSIWYGGNGTNHKAFAETVVPTIHGLMNRTVSQMTNSTGHRSFGEFHTLNIIDPLSGHGSFAEFHTLNKTEVSGHPMARAFAQFGSVANSTVLGEVTTHPTFGDIAKAYEVYEVICMIVIMIAIIVYSGSRLGKKLNVFGLKQLKGIKRIWKNANHDGDQQVEDLEGGNQNDVEKV